MCVFAGPAEGGHRQCAGSRKAGSAGEDGAEDGAFPRARTPGNSGKAAGHGAEEQR